MGELKDYLQVVHTDDGLPDLLATRDASERALRADLMQIIQAAEVQDIAAELDLKADFDTLIQFGMDVGTDLNTPDNPKTNPLVESLYDYTRERCAEEIAKIKQIKALYEASGNKLLGKYYSFLKEMLNSKFYGLSAYVVATKFPESINALSKEDLISLFYTSSPFELSFILRLILYREDREEFIEEVMKILTNYPSKDIGVRIAAYKVLDNLGQLEDKDSLIEIAGLNSRISRLALEKLQPLLGRDEEVVETFMFNIESRSSDEVSSNYALVSLCSNSDDFVTKTILEILKNSLMPEYYYDLIRQKCSLTFTLGLLEMKTSGALTLRYEEEVVNCLPTEQLRLAAASATDKKMQECAQQLLKQRGALQ